MRYVLILMVVIVCHSWAGARSDSSANDPLAEAMRINEAIAQLAVEFPVVIEIEELNALQSEAWSETSSRIRELHATPEYEEYQRRWSELVRERNRETNEAREALIEAGERLYTERHAELRRAAPVDLVQGRQLGLDVLSYPAIDGSTSTHPLSVVIASRLLDVPYEWIYGHVSVYFRTTSAAERALLLPFNPAPQVYFPRDSLEMNLAANRVYAVPATDSDPRQVRTAQMINSLLANHSDTHSAHVNLIEGRRDLVLSARAPSESELKLAEENGVNLVAVPIALDALVFLVSQQNEVNSLTQQQLRAIYEGEIDCWEAVGWTAPDETNVSIVPLRRERDSGSRELFDELLMKGDQLPDPQDPYTVAMYETLSMTGPYNRITTWPNSLGYSVYYYERYMAMSPQTRVIAIDGVEPTFESIASGAYPFVTSVYAVYRESEPADSSAMLVLEWLLSPEGQMVVRESGYVPIQQ